ncbi:hypothetical protein ASH00_15810 [Arthrobacter sp. Soil782]|uniref:hypothetical protein n=1 Tax=Arthrobacter sp. Soil782 TaxID=1736410 RepID=UPI0006F3E65E|nr:hypothetical protein [Arthrobacter sp. Soil782]KRF03250.1 hypothetical protein ASH00_15810 [Arthrobacter sp. Soil782]
MGQNKRYGDSYVDKWIEGWILREEPMTLTAVEVDLDRDPERLFPEPRLCRAWIRYPTKAVRVQASAIAWNSRAVKIRFLEPAIKTEREAWVWTNAVTPEPPHSP